MAGRGMPAAGKGAGWPGLAPGPAVALLPPAHCAVDVRPGAAGRRRRPPGTARRESFAQHRRQAARGLARHREAARQSRRSASRWRPRPSQGQRPRSPSARLPGHSADELCRPRPGLRLVSMAPTPSGPGPTAPLPRRAQSRPRDLITQRHLRGRQGITRRVIRLAAWVRNSRPDITTVRGSSR